MVFSECHYRLIDYVCPEQETCVAQFNIRIDHWAHGNLQGYGIIKPS
jgi:hypothetical protein